ncbi:hypothetical protein AB6G58_15805 [Providencia huaxiensis]
MFVSIENSLLELSLRLLTLVPMLAIPSARDAQPKILEAWGSLFRVNMLAIPVASEATLNISVILAMMAPEAANDAPNVTPEKIIPNAPIANPLIALRLKCPDGSIRFIGSPAQ